MHAQMSRAFPLGDNRGRLLPGADVRFFSPFLLLLFFFILLCLADADVV